MMTNTILIKVKQNQAMISDGLICCLIHLSRPMNNGVYRTPLLLFRIRIHLLALILKIMLLKLLVMINGSGEDVPNFESNGEKYENYKSGDDVLDLEDDGTDQNDPLSKKRKRLHKFATGIEHILLNWLCCEDCVTM